MFSKFYEMLLYKVLDNSVKPFAYVLTNSSYSKVAKRLKARAYTSSVLKQTGFQLFLLTHKEAKLQCT